MNKKLSFIIPCYCSEKTIGTVVKELIEILFKKKENSYEVILINDGSLDSTLSILVKLTKEYKQIKVINLSKNFGQHAAIMAGLHHVDGDIVVCLDDDGQTPPTEIFKLIDKINENNDIVFAKYPIKKHSLFRNFGTNLNNIMAEHLINKPKNISISSYFATKRFIINEIIKYNHPYPYIGGLLLNTSNKIVNVKINHANRISGESGYSFIKLIQLWLNGFTAFSVKPLRIASISGLCFALFGFLYSSIIIINKLTNPNFVAGYASLISVTLFMGGVLMIMLGIIGEYLGRMYIGFNKHPQFIIREKIGF